VRFIGSNDTSTLEGVLEEIAHQHGHEARYSITAKTKAKREAAAYAARVLEIVMDGIRDAMKNGPTPDLTKLRLSASPEVMKSLADQGYGKSADDIANEALARVNLD
jgi:hypothetical protein